MRVQVLLGDDALLIEHLVALVLRLGVGELGFVLLQIGFGLLQRNLVRPGIDHDQQFAGLHVLAFAKIHLHDLAVDAGLQRNRVECLDRTQPGEINVEIALLDRGDSDGNCRRRTAGFRALGLL